jgi:gamma-glutamyltranspeptidase / glutathione hydrolase
MSVGLHLVTVLATALVVSAASPPAGQEVVPAQVQAQEVVSKRGMVVTGCRAASWAGTRMLEAGGNAVDAAVAAAFALGVADPGSCGVGGQTYVLVRLADGRTVAIDGSARAPVRFVPAELQRLRDQATVKNLVYGFKSVVTPGTVAALALALERYGTRSLADVLAPSIELAEFGSAWTAVHRAFLEKYTAKVRDSAYLGGLLLRDGLDVWDPGHVYCNPDLACFLRRLRSVGANDFYRGALAEEIDRDMVANGGYVRLADLGLMSAAEKAPVRGRYRGLEVLSFPFPGGGAVVVEALGILDRLPQELLRRDSVDRPHVMLEACRLAYADAFPVRKPPRSPDELAADPAHLAARAALIRLDRALTDREVSSRALSRLVVDGTTQVSTADAAGNVVSLTQTLGPQFGGGAATVGWGFAYNGLINAYDFLDSRLWSYIEPLQPPISPLAPTILLRDGRPILVIGSAGSARIAPLIVGVIVAVVDRGMTLREAMSEPRALWGGSVDNHCYLEMFGAIDEHTADTLRQRGFVRQNRLRYPATPLDLSDYGGVNALVIDLRDGTMVGVGDPRREGVAMAPGDAPAGEVALPACWRDLYHAADP